MIEFTRFCNLTEAVKLIQFLLSRRLIQLLEKATSSLEVCIYIITCQKLSETIIRVHRKGVRVRIIVDADMADSSGTQIGILRKYGKQEL